MSDIAESPKLVAASSIFGAAVGTILILWVKSVEPATAFTTTLLTLVAGITVITDKVALILARSWERRKHRLSLSAALKRTNEHLQNPDTPEDHRQELMNKLIELQLADIDAQIFNPSGPM